MTFGVQSLGTMSFWLTGSGNCRLCHSCIAVTHWGSANSDAASAEVVSVLHPGIKLADCVISWEQLNCKKVLSNFPTPTSAVIVNSGN